MAGFVGIDKVLRNLSKAIKKIEGGTQAGVLTAALHERGEAQKLCPVDEGNLKSSAYVVPSSVGQQEGSFKGNKAGELASSHESSRSRSQAIEATSKVPMAIIGFSAFYAVYVHEIDRPRGEGGGGYTVGQWKYLETVLVRDRKLILDIIRRKAKI